MCARPTPSSSPLGAGATSSAYASAFAASGSPWVCDLPPTCVSARRCFFIFFLFGCDVGRAHAKLAGGDVHAYAIGGGQSCDVLLDALFVDLQFLRDGLGGE